MRLISFISLFAFCLFVLATTAQPRTNVVPAKHPSCAFRYYPAYRDSTTGRLLLHNEKSGIGRKIGVGTGYVLGYEAAIFGLLYVLPEDVSKWKKNNGKHFGSNYRSTFTNPLVLDNDHWYVNYLGHPYQGAFYYNAVRAQGAEMWQSALFCLGHSLVWEFLLEGAIEQPSVQDILATPIAGSLLGELFHFATIKMSRNGFKWYEKAFVCVFNPVFAIHNGFKFAKPLRQRQL